MMDQSFPSSPFNWIDRLTLDVRTEVLRLHTPVNPRNNRNVFSAGDKSLGLFRVLAGRVDAYVILEDGGEVLFNCYFPGECIGELPVLDGGKHVAALSLTEGARLSRLAPADVTLLRATYSEFDTALTLSVCQMFRQLFKHYLAKLSLDPENILLDRIKDFCTRLQKTDDTHVMIPISQDEFAYMLGVSRRTIVNILYDLEKREIIRRAYRSIYVNRASLA